MTFRDLATTSFGNLKRMKLRATLTISGVVIAVGTFVAMLSFGAGNQQYIGDQFEKFGLLHTIQVFPIRAEETGDTTKPRILDNAAIDQLATLPGVRVVFPFDAFSAAVQCADSQATQSVRGLPLSVLQTKWFGDFRAGQAFASDSAREAIVTSEFLKKFGIPPGADSALGRQVIVSIRKAVIDSGLAQLFPPDREYIRKRIHELKRDSLLDTAYIFRQVRTEAKRGMSEFMDGLLNRRELVVETLTICGVLASEGPNRRNSTPIMTTSDVAKHLSGGIPLDDPTAMLGAITSGDLLGLNDNNQAKSFPRVTLDTEPTADTKALEDSIKVMGFRSFSFADQFEEIKQFFVYFDLGLAVFGLVALVTASLGIINTLVMSVLERRKEIGVMKSLGADERDIRNLFLTESGIIGFLGSVFGILAGWTVSRIASFVAKAYMESQEMGRIELFALPFWLILAALALGICVSVLAGLYPASRAARVDPVEALRAE